MTPILGLTGLQIVLHNHGNPFITPFGIASLARSSARMPAAVGLLAYVNPVIVSRRLLQKKR